MFSREVRSRRGGFSITHQVSNVARRGPSHFYDTLCEAAVVADEASEDSGQAVAGSVQYNSGGGSFHYCLGAVAPCRTTGKKYNKSFFSISDMSCIQ